MIDVERAHDGAQFAPSFLRGVYRRRPLRSTFAALVVLALAISARAASLPEIPLHSTGGILRLALVGDPGAGTADVAAGLAAIHASSAINAILVLGDNIYPCGVKAAGDPGWKKLEPLASLGIPMYAVLGNHDYCGNETAEVGASVFPEWNMPSREYTIRSDVADFAMIDTTPYAKGKTREAESAIVESFEKSAAPWRIVVGHHTIVSSGWHGYFPRAEARRMRQLLPVLRESRAVLYICGHDHHLELLRGDPAFIISGAASEPIPIVNKRDQTLYPAAPHLREPKGFAILEVTREEITVRFHRADGRALSKPISVAKH